MSTCSECGTVYPPAVRICTRDGTVLETEPAVDSLIGTVLDGKYRLDHKLGAGGMGAVYRARHLMLGKAVAVKLIKPELVTSPELVRRFQREARAASTLAHPNIAAAHDLGQTADGTLYIAMEFIDGPSLKDAIKSGGPIEPGRIVRILRQVCSALALAHKNDVIHRDLKPHNIALATDDRGHEIAKLLDFGIAKTFNEATQLTDTGFALGTPQYMSPEQTMGKPVDGRSDIYSLGIILYEMLVGEVPFNDPSTPAVLVKQMTEVPEHPSHRRPDLGISPTLEAVALRCLEKDPTRFQKIEELLTALESSTAAHQIPALPTTVIVPAVSPLLAQEAISRGSQATEAFAPTIAPRAHVPAPAVGAAAAPGATTHIRSAPQQPAGGTETVRPRQVSPPAPAVIATVEPTPSPALLVAAGALAPVPPRPVVVIPAASEKRGISPAVLIGGAVAIVLLGSGVLYGLMLLRAPRENPPATQVADTAALAPSSQSAPAVPATNESAAAPPSTGASLAAGGGAPTAAAPGPLSPAAASGGSSGNVPPKPVAAGQNTVAPVEVARGFSQDARGRSGSTAAAPAAAPAAQSPPAVSRPAVPAVLFRCSGADDICPTVRSTAEGILRERGITVVRDPARADIVVDARVTFGGERTTQSFGTTMSVLTYTTDVDAEAVRSRDAVPMMSPATVSFDNRFRTERLADHARLIATGVADGIAEYWKKP